MRIPVCKGDAEYIERVLVCLRRKVPEITVAEEQEFSKELQVRMRIWEVIYHFHKGNYPASNPLNAEFVE